MYTVIIRYINIEMFETTTADIDNEWQLHDSVWLSMNSASLLELTAESEKRNDQTTVRNPFMRGQIENMSEDL